MTTDVLVRFWEEYKNFAFDCKNRINKGLMIYEKN